MRPTYAEIDLGAIADNVAAFAALIAPSQVCAVVKADAYGHGDAPVAATAIDAGASQLAVALVEEGVRLREAGVSAPILLLSEPGHDAIGEIVEWDLTPTAYSVPFIAALGSTGESVDVHLKVDTGMHRVGAPPDSLDDLLGAIAAAPGVGLGGLWSHFAVADEDPDYTRKQIQRFDRAAAHADAPSTHLANTAGATLFPEARRDMCRIGLGIYGLHPCDETRDVIDLRPAMRVITHVSHVQRLQAGERPSYGRRRPLQRDATVVTVPIGYADGYHRGMSEDAVVLIRGERFPLAGTVTMDQIVIDVGDEDVDIGEEVVVLGEQGNGFVGADEWASTLGTITYEIVCSIGPRVPRRYLS
ncbi:MAG: alanine racemase [Acidimicrobiia bacterium]|nr:alanine racemase [Acidimicrobiia bacterium]